MAANENTTRSRTLNDSKKEALQALISSLSPSDATSSGKLSDVQIGNLSERLDQILGDADAEPAERRNERGEVLNEEGLPVIDIIEPADTVPVFGNNLGGYSAELEPAPLTSLSEAEKRAIHTRQEHILDLLEAEEERAEEGFELHDSQQRVEKLAKRKVDEQADMDRKHAAREMQKKMGKALLKNIAEQREREEKLKAEEAVASMAYPSRNRGTTGLKPRKSVSFANVPEIDKEPLRARPRSPTVWGDVSVGALKARTPRAKLKSEALKQQPIKLEVVERVPGRSNASAHIERDSDDESVQDNDHDHSEDGEATPMFDSGAYSDNESDSSLEDGSNKPDDQSEGEEFELSQAQLQREVALEYMKLRGTIGTEAHQAMTSHTHESDDEWDRPDVPLEATLASKPPKPSVSRFRASRQSTGASGIGTSASLGPSMLPQGETHVIQKALRRGKLHDGKLVGAEDDSASEDDNDDSMKRMLDLLKSGNVTCDSPQLPVGQERPDEEKEASASTSGSSRISTKLKTATSSKFLQGRAEKPPPLAPSPGSSPSAGDLSGQNSPDTKLPLLSSLSRSEPGKPSIQSSLQPTNGRYTEQPEKDKPFRRPPTVILPPSNPPASSSSSQQTSVASTQVKPDPAVLSTTVIDSPSFPPRSTSAAEPSRPPPLLDTVRESQRSPQSDLKLHERTNRNEGGRVSRFKAERL